MEYDEVAEITYKDVEMRYGIIYGKGKLVFIKVGRGGHISGENQEQQNLYITLASDIKNKFGYSVVVSENPLNENRDNPIDDDISFIKKTFEGKYDDIIFVGNSMGANYGGWYGFRYPEIKETLLFNPVLNFNFHRMQECIEGFKGKIMIVMGKNDISAKWRILLPESEKVELIILPHQGHIITEPVFIEEVEKFLYSSYAPRANS